ncbi:putative RNA ligase/tail attachment protein [Vibrio phage phi 3]|uniref:Putative RNA ligase/tail attachment protein n=1 Tax=Vibrio phage phi 3 TaxID=1589298 RepID=A0A0B5H2T8_9CAUD|nr:putative RNA ligase/tail attachment protein [Vibrio phage phi 3]AJF40802.1 putative RNA ligase/tail attachment protein [Vibrio phage phi 3]
MKFNVQDLIDAGLVVAKEYPNGLKVLKYSKEVFFKSLWNTDPRLLECRGRVVDADWNVVVNPFAKVFNYLEQGAGKELHPQCLVRVVYKVNGFLGCVTNTEKYGMLFSTTGTLDSELSKLLEKKYREVETIPLQYGVTYMFEVCDKSDPHVVEEEEGLWMWALIV